MIIFNKNRKIKLNDDLEKEKFEKHLRTTSLPTVPNEDIEKIEKKSFLKRFESNKISPQITELKKKTSLKDKENGKLILN